MGALILIGLLFLLIGLAVLIGGVVTTVRQSRRSAGRAATTGKVVGLVKRVFTPGSAGLYCPVIEFITQSGETVRFESDFGTMPTGIVWGSQYQCVTIRQIRRRLKSTRPRRVGWYRDA